MSCPLWRIGLSESAMYKNYFFAFKIPEPTTCVYKDFSGTFSQTVGGQVQHGYSNVAMRWEALTPVQARFLKLFVDGALGATISGTGLIYMTVPNNNGSYFEPDRWMDISGIPHPLDLEVGGTIPGAYGVYYANVELFINNVTIINNPAVI